MLILLPRLRGWAMSDDPLGERHVSRYESARLWIIQCRLQCLSEDRSFQRRSNKVRVAPAPAPGTMWGYEWLWLHTPA